jgi:hypothetical protein
MDALELADGAIGMQELEPRGSRVEHADRHAVSRPIQMHAEEAEGVAAIAGNDRLDLRGSISDRRMRALLQAGLALALRVAAAFELDRVAVRS